MNVHSSFLYFHYLYYVLFIMVFICLLLFSGRVRLETKNLQRLCLNNLDGEKGNRFIEELLFQSLPNIQVNRRRYSHCIFEFNEYSLSMLSFIFSCH